MATVVMLMLMVVVTRTRQSLQLVAVGFRCCSVHLL